MDGFSVATWFQGEAAPIAPAGWQGEVDCVVGPFSSRKLAQNFVTFEVDFDPETAVVDDIFARGAAWYVELRKLRWG
ncbi:hypothetical protein BH24DEI2_BH24DEI2_23420 [soil metagenome]